MKEIKKEVQRTEEVITYVAIDGKEFKNKEDCKKWEESYECTIRASFNKIPQIKTSCESTGVIGLADETIIILKPRNIYDINVINAYGNLINSFSEPLTQDDIGKYLMIYTGYEEDWFTVYYMDIYLEELINKYNNFKKQVEEIEKENL